MLSRAQHTSMLPNGEPPARVSSLDSPTLSRLWRPVGRFDIELLCGLGGQSLPAELDGVGADDAPIRLTRKELLKGVEADVLAHGAPRDKVAIAVVPQHQARATTKGFEFPPDIVVVRQLGSVGSRHCCCQRVCVPTRVRFTVVPTAGLPSTSKGAHSRRCAG